MMVGGCLPWTMISDSPLEMTLSMNVIFPFSFQYLDLVEFYDGNVCSRNWYLLMTHSVRLDEGSVDNTAFKCACS